jgi:hypothetical protein
VTAKEDRKIFNDTISELLSVRHEPRLTRPLVLLRWYAEESVDAVNQFLDRLNNNELNEMDVARICDIYRVGTRREALRKMSVYVMGGSLFAGLGGSLYHERAAAHAAKKADRIEHEQKAKSYNALVGLAMGSHMIKTIVEQSNVFSWLKIERSPEFTDAVERLADNISPAMEVIAQKLEVNKSARCP